MFKYICSLTLCITKRQIYKNKSIKTIKYVKKTSHIHSICTKQLRQATPVFNFAPPSVSNNVHTRKSALSSNQLDVSCQVFHRKIPWLQQRSAANSCKLLQTLCKAGCVQDTQSSYSVCSALISLLCIEQLLIYHVKLGSSPAETNLIKCKSDTPTKPKTWLIYVYARNGQHVRRSDMKFQVQDEVTQQKVISSWKKKYFILIWID